jgi:nitroreductase
MMAILLAAVNEGLVAGFLGVHSVRDLAVLLHIPEEHSPIGVVTVGYPMPDRRSGSLSRGKRPRATVVHREHWAG